jgi:hypothetical protein
MQQVYGMKVIVLTRGDLTDMWKRSMKHGRNKVYREKSAEAIVPCEDITGEGPNLKE